MTTQRFGPHTRAFLHSLFAERARNYARARRRIVERRAAWLRMLAPVVFLVVALLAALALMRTLDAGPVEHPSAAERRIESGGASAEAGENACDRLARPLSVALR